MSTSAFETYLAKVQTDYRRGIATEHTYRPALKIVDRNPTPWHPCLQRSTPYCLRRAGLRGGTS